MAELDNGKIAQLQKQRASLQTALDKSPTAFATSAAPSESDLLNETRLKSLDSRLQKLKNEELKKQWYGEPKGTDNTDSSGVHPGFIGRTLNALSTPLYGIVGGVEAALGQGSKRGLANIAANIDERDTFSNLLKRNNVPYLLAAPLGFSLDVAFDPVNWATAGTAAIIPRTAYGLAKGTAKGGIGAGIEAAAKGVGYRAAGVGSGALGLVGAGKTNLRKTLKETATRYTDDYDQLTGRDIMGNIGKPGTGIGIFGNPGPTEYRGRVGNLIEEGLSKIPGGNKLWAAFKYDNPGYIKYAKWQDTLERAYSPLGKALPDEPTLAQAEEFVEDIPISSPEARARADVLTGDVPGDASQFDMKNLGDFQSTIDPSIIPPSVNAGAVTARASSLADDTNFIVGNPKAVSNLDPDEQMARFADEINDDRMDRDVMQQLIDEFERPQDITGIKFYDDAMKRVKDFKIKDAAVGAGIMNALGSFIGAFKLSKLGLSPATHFANASSGIPLAMMAGMSITSHNPMEFFTKLKLLQGSPKAANDYIKRLANEAEQGARWVQYMKEHGGTYARVYGEEPEFIMGRGFVDQVLQTGRDAGIVNAANEGQVLESLDQYMLMLRDKLRSVEEGTTAEGLLGIAKNAKRKAASTPDQMARQMADEGIASPNTVALTGAEFNENTWFREKLNQISDAAAKDDASVGAKLMDLFLNKSMGLYGRIDQSWRMTYADWMTLDGLTERELRTMGNMFGFNKADIVGKKIGKNGEARFLVSPDKATELSADILFNYAAMPAAVRMLRSLPILGAPFASFMYGMAMRTAQTLAYNPASFNKINFALNAYSGEQGPIEKEALNSQFYNWYKDPTMIRLPFFDNYPLYLNAANILPYYSMNIFEPPERKYQALLPESVAQIVDKSPFLKDPIGQLMFDYFIMPAMLRDERPLNSFGQPLFPTDATGVEKAGYAARSLADTVTPNLIAPAGLIAGAAAPDSATFLPGYRTRQMAQAVQGKNTLGIQGKEDPASRVLRALGGYAGLPVQRLDPRAATSDIKERLGQ